MKKQEEFKPVTRLKKWPKEIVSRIEQEKDEESKAKKSKTKDS